MDLGGIDGIAHVVPLPVRDIGDQTLRLSQRPADDFYDVDIFHLVMAADVVDLSHPAFVNDQVDGFAVVLHIQPVADILSGAVDRERSVVQGVGDHQRNQLFRKMIGTVVIGAAADGYGQSVGPVIGQDQKVRRRLAGRIRAGGMNRCLIREKEIRPVQRQVSVYFIRGYLVIAPDPVFPAGVHEDGGADDVGVKKDLGILDGTVHVALCGEIHHHMGVLFLKQAVYGFPVRDALPDKTEIRIVHDRL